MKQKERQMVKITAWERAKDFLCDLGFTPDFDSSDSMGEWYFTMNQEDATTADHMFYVALMDRLRISYV